MTQRGRHRLPTSVSNKKGSPAKAAKGRNRESNPHGRSPMNEHQHKSQPHSAHPRKTAEHPHAAEMTDGDSAHHTQAPPSPTIPDELTLYTEDGKWRAQLKAWNDWCGCCS